MDDPVVVVPGLFGSILYVEKDDGERVRAWPSLERAHHELLTMTREGVAERPSWVRGITGEEAAIPELAFGYDKLLARLERRFPDVVHAAYDWRYDLRRTVNGPGETSGRVPLAIQIEAAKSSSSGGQVDVVCHSMGCLAVLVYMITNPDRLDDLRRIVFVAPPFWGTPESYKRILWGVSPFSKDKASMDDRLDWKRIFQNMQGIYQIGPSSVLTLQDPDMEVDGGHSFLSLSTSGSYQNLVPQTYDQSYAGAPDDPIYADALVNHGFLKQAGQWRKEVIDPVLLGESEPRVLAKIASSGSIAYGSGEDTDARLNFVYEDEGLQLMALSFWPECSFGDKNVLEWGMDRFGLDGDRLKEFPGVDHMGLVQEREPLDWIVSQLSNGVAEDGEDEEDWEDEEDPEDEEID